MILGGKEVGMVSVVKTDFQGARVIKKANEMYEDSSLQLPQRVQSLTPEMHPFDKRSL